MRCFIGNPFDGSYQDDDDNELDVDEVEAQIQRDVIQPDILSDDGEDLTSEESEYVPGRGDDLELTSEDSWETFDFASPGEGGPEFSDFEEDDDLDYVAFGADSEFLDNPIEDNSWLTNEYSEVECPDDEAQTAQTTQDTSSQNTTDRIISNSDNVNSNSSPEESEPS